MVFVYSLHARPRSVSQDEEGSISTLYMHSGKLTAPLLFDIVRLLI